MSKIVAPGRGHLKGPLRKIVEVVRFNPIPGLPNRVRLECGHEARSEATYKARCKHCRAESEAAAVGDGQ